MADFQQVGRTVQIARIGARLGLGKVVSDLDSRWHWKVYGQLRARFAPNSMPWHIREAFEDLGGTFVKLGQLLSLRSDLVPPEYCAEFAKLQDHAHPESFPIIKKHALDCLGVKAKDFTHIDPEPLGSASIAQVHRATLHSGQEVVLKIRRPGIAKQFLTDIALMRSLALKLDEHYQQHHLHFSFMTIVHEFERYTRQELDFKNEAKHLAAFHAVYAKHPHVTVPAPLLDYSSDKVLVMEYVRGKKLTEVHVHDSRVHAPVLAQHLTEAFLKTTFTDGIFHGDLHPGNVLLLPRGRVALLDFGIVGSLTKTHRSAGLSIFLGISNKDSDLVIRSLLSLGPASADTRLSVFKREINEALTWYAKDTGGSANRLTSLFHQLLRISISHKLAMPPDVVLLGKAAVTIEGTALYLDEQFNFAEHVEPVVRQIADEQMSFTKNEVLQRLSHLRASGQEFTESLRSVIDRVRDGKFDITVQHSDLLKLSTNIDRSSNRLSFALLACAFLVVGALFRSSQPLYGTISLISLVSFALSALMMLALFFSILHER